MKDKEFLEESYINISQKQVIDKVKKILKRLKKLEEDN